MSRVEEIWKAKTDEEVFDAAVHLADYAEEARETIISEARRRGLDVDRFVEASASFRDEGEQPQARNRCAFCETWVLFGGKHEGNRLFCSEECRSRGILLAVSHQIPEPEVNQEVWSLYQGNCPQCNGSGPVDVHTSYRIWSALLMTSWGSRVQISCDRCGVKARITDSLFCLVLGWWGFPWGLIMTPVQLLRNLSKPSRTKNYQTTPSDQLAKLVRLRMAAEIVSRPADPTEPPGS